MIGEAIQIPGPAIARLSRSSSNHQYLFTENFEYEQSMSGPRKQLGIILYDLRVSATLIAKRTRQKSCEVSQAVLELQTIAKWQDSDHQEVWIGNGYGPEAIPWCCS